MNQLLPQHPDPEILARCRDVLTPGVLEGIGKVIHAAFFPQVLLDMVDSGFFPELAQAAELLTELAVKRSWSMAFARDCLFMTPHDKVLCPAFRSKGGYEPFETDLIAGYLKPGDTVIDAGANLGYYSVVASKTVGPTGTVLAVEPLPAILELLRANLCINQAENTEIHPCAAGSGDSVGTIWLSDVNAGDHRLWNDEEETRRPVGVPVTTIDQIADGRKINLLKMDVQGGELAALQGATETIARSLSMAMAIEFWPYGLKHATGDESAPGRLGEMIFEMGFSVWSIDESDRSLMAVERSSIARMFPDTMDFCNLWCVRGNRAC